LAELIDGQVSRYRYVGALRNLALWREADPNDPAPLVRAAAVHLLRGDGGAGAEACRLALELTPGHERATRLLAEVQSEPRETPLARPTPPPGAVVLDPRPLDRLRKLTVRLEEDRQLNDALLWAQAYHPEYKDWRWVTLFIKARAILMGVDRLRWRVSEVRSLSLSGSVKWQACRADAGPKTDAEIAAWYQGALRADLKAVAELLKAAQLVPPVLATLATTGRGDPLGRMSATRFALMEGDLLLAESQLRRALKFTRQAARDVARAEVERLSCELTDMASVAGPRQLAIYNDLASVRLAAAPDAIRPGNGAFGAACRELAARAAGWDEDAPKYGATEAVRITLQVLTFEAKTETIGVAASRDDS
jgi:hypothetical protein